MDAEQFVFVGGGTGGHLYPGIAVATELRRLRPHASIEFLTTNRPLDRQLLSNTGFTQFEQSVRPFSARPWDWPGFWLAWRASVSAAAARFSAVRPRAVLGLGGYAAGPGVVAARRMGIRTAILNPDAIPGRANRHLAAYADLIITQWDTSNRCFPASAPCRALGCPIRSEFAAPPSAADARSRFGLAIDRPVLLVTGASQGAQTVNNAICRVWPVFAALHTDWQLVHLTGTAHEAAVRAAYVAAGAPAIVLGFTHEMVLALAAADVVVSRAGASTLAELTALGKPSILLPYPFHKDRHQHANAQVLVDAGAAVLIEDEQSAEKTAPPLLAALQELSGAAVRERMAAAARTLARPAAAESAARWLLEP